jgi:hypothetical protein
MTNHTIQQNLDLWEAWIEFDPLCPDCFGTLYLTGEILVDKKSSPPYVRKCSQRSECNTLILSLHLNASNPSRVEEVTYSEPLSRIDQYRSIKIFDDDSLVTEIQDIEVVV